MSHMHPVHLQQGKRWLVNLSCCGYDDGSCSFDDWRKADEFRESYLTATGHRRSAIIKQNAWFGFVPEGA